MTLKEAKKIIKNTYPNAHGKRDSRLLSFDRYSIYTSRNSGIAIVSIELIGTVADVWKKAAEIIVKEESE